MHVMEAPLVLRFDIINRLHSYVGFSQPEGKVSPQVEGLLSYDAKEKGGPDD